MKRKGNTLMLLTLLISGIFTSCFDNFEEREYFSANVTAFSFGAHDSCPDIEDYTFNIDQFNGIAEDSTDGTIFNLDSLPYGSNVENLYPTLSFQSTNGNIYMNDSLWEDKDSLDFTSRVILKNTSYDGLYTRSYSIVVNVHQVDPDSMVMARNPVALPFTEASQRCIVTTDGSFNFFHTLGGGLGLSRSTDQGKSWSTVATDLTVMLDMRSLCRFNNSYYGLTSAGALWRSGNGENWSPVLTIDGSGSPVTLVALYGELGRKYITDPDSIALIGLVSGSSGQLLAARSSNGTVWETGSAVPADFPVRDFSSIHAKTVTNVPYYTIMGGLNAQGTISSGVWSTENGKDWIAFNEGKGLFKPSKRTRATLFEYDGYLVYFGGLDATGSFINSLQVSRDHGKTWEAAPENWNFASLTSGLADASVYVEHQPDAVNEVDREFIWILGGNYQNEPSTVVWKAYLNQMTFARR